MFQRLHSAARVMLGRIWPIRAGKALALAALGACGAMLLVLATPGGALAHETHRAIALHAKLTHADPGIGAVLNSAPSTVTLQFGEDLKPDGSSITVYDDHGKPVSGTASVSSGDPKTMTVSLQADDSETYVVVYHTVSAVDGDAYTDAYNFTVSKDATASPGTQPGTTTSEAESSGSGVPLVVAALIGILGVIVGALGGYAFARRQPAA